MLPGASEGDAPAFFRNLVYPKYGWIPPRNVPMDIVKGFDPDSTPYIG